MARASSKILPVLGKTVDGRTVVGGVFQFYDTYGIPLESILDVLKDVKMVPSWPQFVQDALAGGWTKKKTLNILAPALLEIYGSEYRNTVIGRLM